MTQPDLFPLAEAVPRRLAGCCTPEWHAYDKMQKAFINAELKAFRAHLPVNPIREARRALIHAALAGPA